MAASCTASRATLTQGSSLARPPSSHPNNHTGTTEGQACHVAQLPIKNCTTTAVCPTPDPTHYGTGVQLVPSHQCIPPSAHLFAGASIRYNILRCAAPPPAPLPQHVQLLLVHEHRVLGVGYASLG